MDKFELTDFEWGKLAVLIAAEIEHLGRTDEPHTERFIEEYEALLTKLNKAYIGSREK